MANLKEIRLRINSVSSTKQITSAMKMVSAAKLKKAQDIILQLRPYANKLHSILTNLTASLDPSSFGNELLAEREVNKVLIVSISSNRGLCGAFNSNISKQTQLLANEKYATQFAAGNVHFMTIGKKVYDLLRARQYTLLSSDNHIFENLTFDATASIAQDLMNMYKNQEYDEILLVYNHFKNAAVQELQVEQFLPIPIPENSNATQSTDYILEPGREAIVTELIPRTLKVQLFNALADSYTSEQGARMVAMHKATDNATEMIKQLKLTYNKARQASITKEILEVVSGAESLHA